MAAAARSSCVSHYTSRLRECSDRRALAEGRMVHAQILQELGGADVDAGGVVLLENLVVEMYGKCRSVVEARQVFDALGWRKNVFSWSIIISAYAQNGHFREALQLFQAMDLEGMQPNSFTLSSVVAACSGLEDPLQARAIHSRIVGAGFGSDEFVATAMVAMFSRCDGCWIDAKAVFDGMASRSVVSWNAVISGAIRGGEKDQALRLLWRMDNEGTKPDQFSLTTILSACSSVRECREFHARIQASGFQAMLAVQNSLMDCYGKCGSLRDAKMVFDEMVERDVISWTCLIASYVHNDESREAIAIYELMEESARRSLSSLQPNVCTFTAVAEACSIVGALEQGRALYSRIKSRKLAANSAELGGGIVNMFIRCGSPEEAMVALKETCVASVAAWNFVIASIAQADSSAAADVLELFGEMALEGTKADGVTFAAALGVCTNHVDRGKSLHSFARDAGLDRENAVGAALIAMYSRSGRLDEAWTAFEKIREKSVVAWSSLMTGYAQQGKNWRALQLYEEMILESEVLPDKFTFSTILGVCAELGAAEEGRRVHSQMLACLGFERDAVLGTSLIDMFAKCGNIDAAKLVFDGMLERNVQTWTTLVAGLARHGRGEQAVWWLRRMSMEGFCADQATVTTILHGCNHGGLIDAGRCCFRLAGGEYGIQASCEHYDCVVDLLGRAGRLKDAESLAAAMDDQAPWRILLGACRIHADLAVAKRAAPRVVEESHSHAMLLSNIYSDGGAK
ncbi:pentatricopeptide repeat-containing protein At3g09040, mitochondrial [Selaginella moellendorffii]|uniref:pentatricopeptide repeat-containing protein At3g09040, mitochondrial n=1 Tax=Selaginella moellendorffii TaxID=88036 RepID=UPI000D1C5A68|nr:pentatricopeptide repeat-containing protein At3g09040, mitochondrial [Selaginella moellendorffii]|eukprot:XP_024539069.1 pentatricopeptide repeat-containing protein At3g09040, mitochondrial [Selaginella moellendorffii]